LFSGVQICPKREKTNPKEEKFVSLHRRCRRSQKKAKDVESRTFSVIKLTMSRVQLFLPICPPFHLSNFGFSQSEPSICSSDFPVFSLPLSPLDSIDFFSS
jgi:hypothetical protein